MKSFASFLAGTTALVVCSSAALAADMDPPPPGAPVKVQALIDPPPPVANCEKKHGKGFYFAPGTQTCVKLTGLIRAQIHIHEDTAAEDSFTGDEYDKVKTGFNNNDTFVMGATGRLGADTVTDTEYGKLRGLVMLQVDPQGDGSFKNVAARYAFIQWGGITAGLNHSNFGPDGSLGAFVIGDYDARLTQLAYTAEFTKEVSATLALEDHDARDGDPDGSLSKGGAETYISNTDYATDSTYLPDLVGNVVGKFDWATLFVSGAVGQYRVVSASTPAPNVNVTKDFIGWAVGAGGTINLDMLAKGDAVQAKFGYADGATDYVGGQEFAIFDATDADYNLWNVRASSAWTATASAKHNWSPTWSSTVYGGYIGLDRDANSPAGIFAKSVGSVNSAWNVGTGLAWTPVEKLTVAGDVFFNSTTRQDDPIDTETTETAIGSNFKIERAF